MRAYSMDWRERVLAAGDGRMTPSEAAEAFAVSPAWVRRLKHRREGDNVPAPVAPRRPPPARAAHADRTRAEVRAAPGATRAERKARVALGVSLATPCRPLQARRLTLNRSPAGGRAGPAGRGGRAG